VVEIAIVIAVAPVARTLAVVSMVVAVQPSPRPPPRSKRPCNMKVAQSSRRLPTPVVVADL
jgi:hypothetical protein